VLILLERLWASASGYVVIEVSVFGLDVGYGFARSFLILSL